MNKLQAKKKIIDYFNKNTIKYEYLNEENKPMTLDALDTVYLCACVPEVIGGHIETSIRFRDDHLYCQSYYCQPVVHNEEEAIKAARIVNYLNMNLDHILNFGVQQITDVCLAVLCYIHGDLDYFTTTKVAIDHKLMDKPIPRKEDH